MKNILLITCCFIIFNCYNGIANNSIISSEEKSFLTENQPQQSGSSVIGGLLILVSIGIGYGTRKIYEFRSKNQEEVH